MAGQFAEPFGGASCRSAQRHPVAGSLIQSQNGIDRGGLAGTRTAGEYHHAAGQRQPDSLPLQRRIGKALRKFQHVDIVFQCFGRLCGKGGHLSQPCGNILLSRKQIRQINIIRPLKRAQTQFPHAQKLSQSLLHLLRRNTKEPCCAFQQLLPGQTGVPVARVVPHGIQQPCSHAQTAALLKIQLSGDTVRLTEFQIQRLTAQQIGILVQRLHGTRTKAAVGGHRLLGIQPVSGKPRHDLPHAIHAVEFFGDGLRFFRGYSFNLAQLLRRFGNDVESLLPEPFHDFFRGGRADERQRSAGKVAEQRRRILRQ